MDSCPIEGTIYKRDDGLVIIDPRMCTGCKNCIDACPYNVIFFNEDLNIAQKCTGCAHLIDSGWKEPRCADACPTLAIRFMGETEAKELISKAEVWKPELKNKIRPRVYYLNLPRKFIAGTVYDPGEKEVVIGATCTLKETPGGKKYTVKTDSYGDFWFEGLKDGKFNLEIRKGRRIESFAGLNTAEEDINLGDIPLT
jgi:ferredoxin